MPDVAGSRLTLLDPANAVIVRIFIREIRGEATLLKNCMAKGIHVISTLQIHISAY